ncbi:hypothetical protein JOC77_002551 [Peribacillus deserti]|uniref:Uncharacterized protein n=1 Tax=Peribacillus deserti TaxID=673318 RepID=A0ABS2QIZ0_9BACI|nr:hypothetical protein [Peribacillus deserti]
MSETRNAGMLNLGIMEGKKKHLDVYRGIERVSGTIL